MAYELVGFVNDTVPDINAENLNHMESGIADNDKRISNLSNIGKNGNVVVFSSDNAKVGTIDASTGNNINSTSRIRTKEKRYFTYARVNSGYKLVVYVYDLNGTYVGVLKTNGSIQKSASNIALLDEYFFSNAYIYRLILRRSDDGNIAIEEVSNLIVYENTDKTLSNSDKSADAKVVGEKFQIVEDGYANYNTTYSQGSLDASYGGIVTNPARIRNDVKFTNENVIKAECDDDYSFTVYAYNGDTYIGILKLDGSFAPGGSNLSWVKEYYFRDDYDYKVVLKKDDGSNITPTVSSHIRIKSRTDEALSEKGKSADAYVTGNSIAEINENLTEIANGIRTGEIDVKRFGLENFSLQKAIDSTGAVISNNRSYCTENYYEVGSEDLIVSEVKLASTASEWYHFIFFYDAEYTYLNRQGGKRQNKVSSSIPEDAKYFRISLTYVTIGNVSEYGCSSGFYVEAASTPKNKWYVFGDSISAGYFSITDEEAEEKGYHISYRPAGLEGVGSVWMKDLSHNYWGYANTFFLHRELVPSAYPGQGYFKVSADGNNGISKVKNTDVSDAGLITVAWGFNDWHYNMERGNHDLIDPSVPYPGENYDTTQITTVNQAIWYCLGELLRKAPNAKIVVQTPMNGWLYGGDWDSWWGLGTEKSHSGTLANIHDDIVYWANYYGLQILEMTYNNSVVNRRNIKDVLLDGSHPSDPAHMQLGRHVGIALKYM